MFYSFRILTSVEITEAGNPLNTSVRNPQIVTEICCCEKVNKIFL